MATCHHLVDIDNEIQGDMLDCEMFKFSKGQLNFNCEKKYKMEATVNNQGFGVIEIFDFSSDIAMMSVIVEDKNSGQKYVLAKGAPEMIRNKSVSKSIPDNFEK